MNRWTSDAYRTNAAYVPALGAAVLELLNPRLDEHILDVGCGDGTLTEKIVAAGATVVGIDASEEMIAAARRALKLGGRFVAEFGGHGNIAAIQVEIRSVPLHLSWDTNIHRYSATPAEYSVRLQAHGFAVQEIALIPRPTPLPTGIRERFIQEVEDLLREEVCDAAGNLTAHYVRLRFLATATVSTG